MRPTAHGQLRGMAMVQGAVYDAVNAIDRGYQPYLLDGDSVGVGPEASFERRSRPPHTTCSSLWSPPAK